HVAQVHPGVEHGRDERLGGACVGAAGCDRHPAASTSRRRRRVAAWRTIRALLLSRIGPLVRAPRARSMARTTAGGGGTQTPLVPLAAHAQPPAAVFFAEAEDAGAGGLKDPQAEKLSMAVLFFTRLRVPQRRMSSRP